MNSLWQDLRYAARLLRKAPGFTFTAIVVIALGIGANSAIFSLVDAVLLRPLAYPHPEQLVRLWEHPPGFERNTVSQLNFDDWRKQNTVFSSIVAVVGGSKTLTAPTANPMRIPGQGVTEKFFEAFGVRPVAGRFLAAEDYVPGVRSVVLSEPLWKSRFGGDASLVGRQITLDGAPWTVVGIAPKSFQILYAADLWAPFRVSHAATARQGHFLQVMGRMKPGVTIDRARANMETIAAGISAAYPETNKGWSVTISGLREATVGDDLKTTSMMLGGVAMFVLLMGCANVASLLLARGIGRTREIAVRAALGVTRGRLLQQLLTESMLLAILGGTAGIALAWSIVRAAPSFLPPGTLPVAISVSLDARVIAFASIATLLTGFLFGLAPALQAARLSLADTLRSGGRGSSAGATFRTVLASAEIAVAVMLVAGSGLLLRTLASLNGVDAGFQTSHVLTMRLNTPANRYQDGQSAPFQQRVEREIRSVPGVENVGLGIDLPVDGWSLGQGFDIVGEPQVDKAKRPGSHYQVVNAGWFDTLGIRVVAGRAFNDRDTQQSPKVCMVNEEIMRRYFAGANPVGQRINVASLIGQGEDEREIVGVVKQIRVQGLSEETNSAEIYVPNMQDAWASPMIAIKTQGDPMSLLPGVREAIARVDKDLPLTRILTMDEVAAQTIAQPRFRARLVGAFAGLALVLAAVGVFGVLAFSVSQRTREFGIRMALGAESHHVLTLVLRRGLAITGAGVAVGLLGAMALTRFVASLLFHVAPLDPLTFAAAPLVLAIVALAACAIPALRASRVNPAVALHAE